MGRVVDDSSSFSRTTTATAAWRGPNDGRHPRPARGGQRDHMGARRRRRVFLPTASPGGNQPFFQPFALTDIVRLLASVVVGADGHPGPRLLPGRGPVSESVTRRRTATLDLGARLLPDHRSCCTADGPRSATSWAFALFVASLFNAPCCPRLINSGSESCSWSASSPPAGTSSPPSRSRHRRRAAAPRRRRGATRPVDRAAVG